MEQIMEIEGVVKLVDGDNNLDEMIDQLELCQYMINRGYNFDYIKYRLPFILVPNVMEFIEIIEYPYVYTIDRKENILIRYEILLYDSVNLIIYINDIETFNLSDTDIKNILKDHLPYLH